MTQENSKKGRSYEIFLPFNFLSTPVGVTTLLEGQLWNANCETKPTNLPNSVGPHIRNGKLFDFYTL